MLTNPDFPILTCEQLAREALAAKGSLKGIVLSWTAGDYDHVDTAYHLNIDAQGQVYKTCSSLLEEKPLEHYYPRGTLQIALDCCQDVVYERNLNVPTSFGNFPPTQAQIDQLGRVVATLCKTLSFPDDSIHVAAHWEYAIQHQFGPRSKDPHPRFDLIALPHFAAFERFYSIFGGCYVRNLVRDYLQRI